MTLNTIAPAQVRGYHVAVQRWEETIGQKWEYLSTIAIHCIS